MLADGSGGYVGNSSSQQKVVQGGDYNNMGGLKPTKIIKTGNGVTADTQETANNGGAPAADLSSLPVGSIATAIAQNTGLPANFIWAQLSHESDGGNSKLAREDHNYGGVKGNDGEYLHFDNDQQFIDYMSDYYPSTARTVSMMRRRLTSLLKRSSTAATSRLALMSTRAVCTAT